ncbi:hypothetical protein ACM66B_005883 [Microbotryomycetes sp. NB124-2]
MLTRTFAVLALGSLFSLGKSGYRSHAHVPAAGHHQVARGYEAYDGYLTPSAAAQDWQSSSWSNKDMQETGWAQPDDKHASKEQSAKWKGHATSSTWSSQYTAAAVKGEWDSCMQQCQAQCQTPPLSMSWSASWQAGASDSMTAGQAPSHASAPPAYASAARPYASAAPAPVGDGGMPLMPGPNQVIVAPIKGDLRMVPFNIQAAPGTVIEFVWGAGPHTVTKSSLPNICQKTDNAPFASGVQQAGFKWEYKVESNETISYFCGVEPHCQKGMFGLINGLVSLNGNNTMDSWMKSYAKQNASFAAAWDETEKTCAGTAAASWGGKLDVTQFPDWALPASAQAILTTRTVMAQKLASDAPGSVSVSESLASTPAFTSDSGPASLPPSSTGSSEPTSTSLPENGSVQTLPAGSLLALAMLLTVSQFV